MKSIAAVCLLFVFSTASCQETGDKSETEQNYLKEMRVFKRLYDDCSGTEWSSCLKIKLISAIDRASKSYKTIDLIEGVSFVNEKYPEDGAQHSDINLERSLPRSADARERSLNEMIIDRILHFFSTFTLQIKLPNVDNIRSSISEARGKGKKYGYFLFLPLMMVGTALPLALGLLALLAGKALIVSKLALLLAGIVGLKKLFSHHDHDHHHGGLGRQFQTSGDYNTIQMSQDAQDMAYRGYFPQQ